MTVQKRTLISPVDILAIEYECPHCHVRHSIPILKLDRVLRRCPNCNEDWLRIESEIEPDDAVLGGFVRYLKEIQRRKFGTILRLEIMGMDQDK